MRTTYMHTVSGYELDSFGHVNNAVYLNFLEAARWDGLRQINAIEILHEYGLFPIIIETNIRYLNELKLFDSIIINTEWKCNSSIIENNHKIFRQGKLITKAVCKIVLVSEDRIIHDVPTKMRQLLEKECTKTNG